MTGHFPLDETSGKKVTDIITGNRRPITHAESTTSWTPGVLGGALYLDGIDDRAIIP